MEKSKGGLPFDFISDFIFVESELVPSDIILIPGSDCKELMIRAVELINSKMAPLILVSGGYNQLIPDFRSESEYLLDVAMDKGLSRDVVILEENAKNTFENAVFSWNLIKSKKLSLANCILVCKEYHSRRALLTYQARFPSNIRFFVSTVEDYKGINKHNWYVSEVGIKTVMNEVVKIGSYFKEEIRPIYESIHMD
ncbi:MAG: YdcF family protein [Bacillota bacterium]|nr:YdcF family protein [Bacillota bacterium]